MDQLAPYDAEVEAALLGCVLINPAQALAECGPLDPTDFFVERHAWIWEAVQELKDKTDAVLVASALQDKGRLTEAGGAAYVLSLQLRTPSILNAQGYAERVRALAVRRRMLDYASVAARAAHSEDQPIERLLEQLTDQLKELTDKGTPRVGNTSVAEWASAEIDRAGEWAKHPERIRGYRTGMVALDQMSTGLQAGEMTLLVARPNMGKSALLAQMTSGLAASGTPVLVFSLEMTHEALFRRMACQLALVSSSMLRQGALRDGELADYFRAVETLSKRPVYIIDRLEGPRTAARLQALARPYIREQGVKVVMIDTADKMQSSEKRGKQYEVSSLVSGDLAAWAHDDGLALVVAKQMNREAPQRQDKAPTLTDIRDSGAWEQDADNVWALHRPGYYDHAAGNEAIIRPLKARETDAVAANKDVVFIWKPFYTGFAPAEAEIIELNDTARPGRKERAA